MQNRIKEVRERLGIPQYELADKVNLTAVQIGRLEKGTRRLSTDWLNRIANALGVSPVELLPQEMSAPVSVKTIYKVGNVQAGKFNEACQLPQDEWEEIPYPINSKYSNSKIFALGVKGDSMNLVFPPEKTTLICCPLEDWIELNEGEDIEGKYIIAYRHSPDGLCEATVKKYTKIDTSTVILVAESTNPEIKPIVLHPDSNEYVIAAVVIGDMRIY